MIRDTGDEIARTEHGTEMEGTLQETEQLETYNKKQKSIGLLQLISSLLILCTSWNHCQSPS